MPSAVDRDLPGSMRAEHQSRSHFQQRICLPARTRPVKPVGGRTERGLVMSQRWGGRDGRGG